VIKIYENFWLFKLPFMGEFTGIALTKKRVAFAGRFNLWLFAHELGHVEQMRRFFWFFIWDIVYFLQWIRVGFSYENIPFEVEARAKTGERYEQLVKGIGIEVIDPKYRPRGSM
jgi:hypothetical protein